MPDSSAEDLLQSAQDWWSTSITDIRPGHIALRGYAIEDLIGRVTFPEMIWMMLRGELPSRSQAKLFEAALVAAVDHGPQSPSVAVARMAVTCGLPVNGAMASAINVLDDIHGGAGQQCMELYAQISEEIKNLPSTRTGPEAVSMATENVVERWREAGTKFLPGFGHRFHPVDPRAGRLLELVDAATDKGIVTGHFAEIGRCVSVVLQRGRDREIPMNIDGVTAVVYSELGFPPVLGRGIFILSRSVGLLAHAWEQTQQGGRIKGPMPPSIPYRYTGPAARAVPDMDQHPSLSSASTT